MTLDDLVRSMRDDTSRHDDCDCVQDLHDAADYIERLRDGLTAAVAELDAEHRPYDPRSGSMEPWDLSRTDVLPGCVMCWPHNGGWPCTSRAIADDLRVLLVEGHI